MASLKRYRQTNDSNAAARFRDLPPRFKRQKSIPSTESGTAESPVRLTHNQKPKKFSQGDCLISEKISANDNSLSGVVKESESSKDKRMMKRGSGSHPQLTVDRNFARRVAQPIVLSPMDNKLFNFVRNDEQESSSMADFNPFSWQNQQQQLQWPRTYDHTGNFQTETLPYNGTWTHTPSTHQSKESPLYHNTNHPGATEPPKDYSENDRRIIEMFKELERVADQKEKEEDEDGTDRKSLVSHHLRMLMCAIDKYTEGIEDEEEFEGREDESFYNDSSPPSSAKNIAKTSISSKANLDNQQSAQLFSTNVTSTAEAQTVPSIYVQSPQTTNIFPTTHQRAPYNAGASHNEERPSDVMSKRKPSLSIDMQPWDLWSSPSFNVLDVYSHLSKGHNSSETADSTFALFDQLGMENDYSPRAEEYLNRTPLYQR